MRNKQGAKKTCMFQVKVCIDWLGITKYNNLTKNSGN